MPVAADTNSITILLIEDSDAFSRAVSAMLGLYAPVTTTVVMADKLAKGLELLGQRSFDLVLLDLTLPDSHGLETLEQVRAASPSVPVVVLTGLTDEHLAVDALGIGAQDYLLKGDINARELNRTVVFALERKRLQRAESERIKLYEQREDFMATLTHDLKNPLIGANRVLELVCTGQAGDVSHESVHLLQKVRESNSALLAMIRNLVEVYRYEKDINTLIRENTDLSHLVRKYLDEVEPLFQERGVTVHSEFQEHPQKIFADQHAILRVVQNLVENAIKFSPSGGMVSVKLWQDDRLAMLAVSDNGPGIAEADIQRLFQRFWQGHAGRTHTVGTGLGLYLCRQIVEAHDGRISCTSKEREGSTFTVSLPLAS
ncbi:MAG TPA: hybrid sensor histidine kinase/response regulator [Planktothrix sp.]